MDDASFFPLKPFLAAGAPVAEALTEYAASLRSKDKDAIAVARVLLLEAWVDVAIQNETLEKSIGQWIQESPYGIADRSIVPSFLKSLEQRKEMRAAKQNTNVLELAYGHYQQAQLSRNKDRLITARAELVNVLVDMAIISPDVEASFATWLERHMQTDHKIKTEFENALKQRRTGLSHPGRTISQPQRDGTSQPSKDGAFLA